MPASPPCTPSICTSVTRPLAPLVISAVSMLLLHSFALSLPLSLSIGPHAQLFYCLILPPVAFFPPPGLSALLLWFHILSRSLGFPTFLLICFMDAAAPSLYFVHICSFFIFHTLPSSFLLFCSWTSLLPYLNTNTEFSLAFCVCNLQAGVIFTPVQFISWEDSWKLCCLALFFRFGFGKYLYVAYFHT